MPQGRLTKEWHTGRRILKPGSLVNVTNEKYKELESLGYFSETKTERKAAPITRFTKTEVQVTPVVKDEGDE